MSKTQFLKNLSNGVASMEARKARLSSFFSLPDIWVVLSGGEVVEFCSTSETHARKFYDFIPDQVKPFFDLVVYSNKNNARR